VNDPKSFLERRYKIGRLVELANGFSTTQATHGLHRTQTGFASLKCQQYPVTRNRGARHKQSLSVTAPCFRANPHDPTMLQNMPS
jgi:hypothetical protein